MTDKFEKIPVSPQLIEQFITFLAEKKRGIETLKKYRADLMSFYNFLPKNNKSVSAKTVANWQVYLLRNEFADRTVNARVSAANSFISYLGRPEWRIGLIPVSSENYESKLSREEYLLLLEAAKIENMPQAYYLLKLFCCADIILSDLPYITVDAVKQGVINSVFKHKPRTVSIPPILQTELLEYIDYLGITSDNRIFTREDGAEFTKTYINIKLKHLCAVAGVSPSKGSVLCLRKLRQKTYADIKDQSLMLINREYNELLAQEKENVSWDSVSCSFVESVDYVGSVQS